MPKRLYVSQIEAGYFIKNALMCAPNIPTKGVYNVGDVVISSVQQNDIFGWVCVEAGEPGKWEVICDIVEVKNGIKQNSNNINSLISRMTNAEVKIVNIENVIVEIDKKIDENVNAINTQIEFAKKTLTNLSTQIGNNVSNIANLEKVVNTNAGNHANDISNINKNITDLQTIVGNNANDATEAASGLLKEINDLKDFVGLGEMQGDQPNLLDRLDDLEELIGANAKGDEEAQKGILQQLEELKERIDINDEADEVSREAMLEELTSIRQIVGLENKEDGEPSLQDRLDEIEGLIGKVDGNTYTVPLSEQIKDLQNLVGTPAKGEDSATGLHRKIENLQETIEEVKDDYLKFWVGTNAEYQALTRVEHGRLYIIID